VHKYLYFSISFFALILLSSCGLRNSDTVDCQQILLGIAPDWNSSKVQLALFERDEKGKWQQLTETSSARLGRAGLVWGLGYHRNPPHARIKREGDGRSPAGVFPIGGLWTYTNKTLSHHPNLETHKISPADLWVSDIRYPKLYNRHLRLSHPAQTAWEKNEQMRQNDPAHSIKLLIGHNTKDIKNGPVLGAGSSIFFHLWRDKGGKPTAGCTSMDERILRQIIARLDPAKRPCYVLLPRNEYIKKRQAWKLP